MVGSEGAAIAGTWTWTDAIIFLLVIVSLKLVMFVLLTRVYFGMLPEGDRCPLCDSETHEVERTGPWRLLGFSSKNRRSWCVNCGWEGVLRRSDRWLSLDREKRRAWKRVNATRSQRKSGALSRSNQ